MVVSVPSCSLDDRIQWLTEYKQYRTEADTLNAMLEDSQSKLESCEKPTSSKAERDKQAAFLNVRNIYTSEDKTIAS